MGPIFGGILGLMRLEFLSPGPVGVGLCLWAARCADHDDRGANSWQIRLATVGVRVLWGRFSPWPFPVLRCRWPRAMQLVSRRAPVL